MFDSSLSELVSPSYDSVVSFCTFVLHFVADNEETVEQSPSTAKRKRVRSPQEIPASKKRKGYFIIPYTFIDYKTEQAPFPFTTRKRF